MPEMKSHQVRDPVCGAQMNEQDAAAKTTFQGREYHFCSEECKDKFDRSPKQYAKAG